MLKVRSMLVALMASALICGLSAPSASAFPVVTLSVSGAGSIPPTNCGPFPVPNGTTINCGQYFTGNEIILVAVDSGQSKFVRWEGCQIPNGTQCRFLYDNFPFPMPPVPLKAVFEDKTAPSLGTPTAALSTVNDRSVTVSWSPNETLTAAQCTIDGVAGACTGLSSHTVTLPEGEHRFSVRGTDINGNVGGLTAEIKFRILDTAFVTLPAAVSSDKNPTFVFSSLTGLTFDCSIDNVTLVACGAKGGDNRGSRPLTNLADGTHTFRVRARDGGEFDRVPAVFTWVVDTIAPTATLGASGPGEGALQAVNRETFVFSSSEDSSFECQLDGAGFAPCASGITLEGLSASAHKFEVRAIDAAGNVGPAVARNWVVFAFPNSGPAPITPGATNTEQIVVTLAFFASAKKKTTKFTTLQVKNVPLNSTVTVTCAGKGCPSGLKGKGFTKTKAFGTVTLAKFIKKPLRAGDKITVTVSKPNAIAAVKVLTVRASKKPLIATKCVPPGTTKPVAC